MASKSVITLVVLGILGIILIASGLPQFAEAEQKTRAYSDDYDDWAANGSTGATLTLLDKDDSGEVGFSFYVKSSLEDVNQNGIFDHCEGLEINITSHPDIVEDFAEEEDFEYTNNGGFYLEVSDGDRCKTDDYDKDLYFGLAESQGFLKVGRGCYGCGAGEMNFTSNQSVWVSYDDEVLYELGGLTGRLWVEGLALTCSGSFFLCCGVSIFIIGLFTKKDPPPPVFTQQLGTHPVVQQNMMIHQQQEGTSAVPWASIAPDDEDVVK